MIKINGEGVEGVMIMINDLQKVAALHNTAMENVDLAFLAKLDIEKCCLRNNRPCCITAYHLAGVKPSWQVVIHEHTFEDGDARWIDDWPVANGTMSQVLVALRSIGETLGYMMHIQDIRGDGNGQNKNNDKGCPEASTESYG